MSVELQALDPNSAMWYMLGFQQGINQGGSSGDGSDIQIVSIEAAILTYTLTADNVRAFVRLHPNQNIYWHSGSAYSGGNQSILLAGIGIYTYIEDQPGRTSIWTRIFATKMDVLDAQFHVDLTEYNTPYSYDEVIYKLNISSDGNVTLDRTKNYAGWLGVGSASYLP